jgi:hypothetical protein
MKYDLRSICKVANRLRKEVKRSEAFKRAWEGAKQGIIEKVVGVTYDGRQGNIKYLDQFSNADIQINIEHEMDNPFDDRAVAVIAKIKGHNSRIHVGYLNRVSGSIWSDLLDSGVAAHAGIQGIIGGYYPGQNYGLRIRIYV